MQAMSPCETPVCAGALQKVNEKKKDPLLTVDDFLAIDLASRGFLSSEKMK